MAAISPTLSGDLFHTMTEWPEFSRFLTIPEPIIPRPRNPNFSAEGRMFFSFSVCDTLSTSSGGVIWWKNRINAEAFSKTVLRICACDIQYSTYNIYTHNLKLSSRMWHCISGHAVHDVAKYRSAFTLRTNIPLRILFRSKSLEDEGPMIICNTGYYYPSQNTPPIPRTLECSATPLRNLISHMELLMSTDSTIS